jgi:membrane protein implicated in regulation of membrane protease activity
MSLSILTLLAIAIGIGVGLSIVLFIFCQNQSHNSMIDPDRLIGRNAIVEVPLAVDHRGKVIVQYRQQAIAFTAKTTCAQTLLPGEVVVIIDVDGAIVTVLPESALYSTPTNS